MANKQFQNGQFCWNELITNDVAKAKEFYGNLFGWESHDMDMGEHIYTLLKNGELDIAGLNSIAAAGGQGNPRWMQYIYVDDIEETVKKAQSLGATLKYGVASVGDMGQMAVIQDPTGAIVALWHSTNNR